VKTQICVTITAPSMAELRARRDAVVDADLVELRLDTVSDPDVAGALEGRRTPVIVTCRPQWEGGSFAGSEEERCRILAEAQASGAEYVDVEFRAKFTGLIEQARGRGIVLSSHDFDAVPADLADRARAMRGTGAEVIKLAARANRLSDQVPLMELGAKMGAHGKVVMIAMGERGTASRVLASRFSSAWTYAGMLGGIGQITPSVLADEYRFREIGASTRVYGLAGSPVSHSVSPAMHNAAFAATKLDAVYLPLDAADADDFATFATAFKLSGASVTIPFKVDLYDRVAEADAVSRRIGALNTIRIDDGRWLGGNTDASGFLMPLQERQVPTSGMRVAILGAGGAARAVAIALSPGGADITVHARKPEQARDVAVIVAGKVGPFMPAPGSWDLLVNCTPIGMHPRVDATPVPKELLAGGMVYDLIYNPAETRLLREAARAGCRVVGGLDMLVAQAQEQFRWWTGTRPPAGVMRAAAVKRLSETFES
jgi:3-dehydroquinate dehydratase / shikimate dehydrogenase